VDLNRGFARLAEETARVSFPRSGPAPHTAAGEEEFG